jgi:putative membrane protein
MRGSFLIFVFVAALVVAVVVIGVIEFAPGDASGPSVSWRPGFHAALNGACAALLLTGWAFVRKKAYKAHFACMLAAGLLSLTFLASYLHYHATAGSTKFAGEGLVRPVYFAILLSHTVLAAIVAPLAGSLFWFAAKRNWARHRAIARWALPIWVYTSVTGVLIYYMLHVWFRG